MNTTDILEQATFNGFEIELTRAQAAQGSHAGRCDEDIEELLRVPHIAKALRTINPSSIAEELEGFGAWDSIELADYEANLRRILWVACGNIQWEQP